VLAHGLREPGRPWDALHGSGGVGRAVEVPRWLDEGVECDRHADELPWARRLPPNNTYCPSGPSQTYF
jgi:hypothetical protein